MSRPETVAGDEFVAVSPPGAGLSRRLLSQPGGFLWWYADLIDRDHNGLVVIWSFGLPFLPGYAQAARQRRAPCAGARPSLNVATYRRGRLDFYLLQEFDCDEVEWKTTSRGDRWRFGNSRLASCVSDHDRELAMDLRLEVPVMDSPVRLRLDSRTAPIRFDGHDHDPMRRRCKPLPAHDWVPLTCGGPVEATMVVDDETNRFSGRLYHDRNGGCVPLHEQGIRNWTWGRIALPESELVYYGTCRNGGQRRVAVWQIDGDGRLQRCESVRLKFVERRFNGFGLRWWSSMAVERQGRRWLDVDHCRVVDSSPFYLRTLVKARDRRGRTFAGVAEVCEPERVDLRRHRPLVKMRVHHRSGPNSMWLPLFSGPKKGRVRRWWRSMWAGDDEGG